MIHIQCVRNNSVPSFFPFFKVSYIKFHQLKFRLFQTFLFQFICSYLFMPLAFLMGVEWKDSFQIAELIGVKTFLTEFFAYHRLSKLIENRKMMNTNDTDVVVLSVSFL